MAPAGSGRWPILALVVATVVLAPATASVVAADGHGTSIPVDDSEAAPDPENVTVEADVTQAVVGDGSGEALVFDSGGAGVDFATDCGFLHVALDVGALPPGALTDETEADVELADEGGFLGGLFSDDQFAVRGTSVEPADRRVEVAVEVNGCEEGDASALAIDAIELSGLDLSNATPGQYAYDTGAYFVNRSDEEGPDAFGGGAFDDALAADVYGLASFAAVDSTPPEADAGEDVSTTVGENVTFDGSGSSDDVAIDSYEWDVDDDGTYELSGATPSHAFEAPGSYPVELRVTDASGNTDTDSVTVSVEERPAPTANDDSAEVTAGGSVTVDVLANDEAAEGELDPSTVTVTSAPASGTTSVNRTTGVVTYDHGGAASDDDAFRYVVNDTGGATSNEATVSVAVAEGNEPPTVDPIGDRSLAEGETATVDVSASDPDGDAVALTLAEAPAFASLEDHGDGTGTLTLAPGPGAAGEHRVTVRASDGNATANASTTVTVTAGGTGGGGEGGDADDGGDGGDGGGEGGGGGDGGGGDGGDGDGDALGGEAGDGQGGPAEAGVSTTRQSPNRIAVDVEGLRAGEPLTVRLPPFEGEAGAGTQLAGFVVRPAADGDLQLGIERAGAPPEGTAPVGDAGSALAYYTVDHDVPAEDVESVTLGFRIEKSRLDAAGADAGSVAVYRYEGDGWARYEAKRVDEDADAYYYTATVPGFSRYAVVADAGSTETGGTGAGTAADSTAGSGAADPTSTGAARSPGDETPAGGPVGSPGGLGLDVLAVLGVVLVLFGVGYYGSGPLYERFGRP